MLIADVSNPLLPTKLNPTSGPAGVSGFSAFIAVILKTFFVAGFVLFMVYFLLGAITWITSAGDAKAVEKARNSIAHALLGIVVMLSLFAILRLIEAVFDVNILQIDLESIKI
ncbi:MAG: hypothetical protein HY376_04065 [Candidatus Blackburnbacteria bacterium]|nr:hypothetical protein [Candidatus Blackburnbacteria bacterium]